MDDNRLHMYQAPANHQLYSNKHKKHKTTNITEKIYFKMNDQI